jgi:hypothetical protein
MGVNSTGLVRKGENNIEEGDAYFKGWGWMINYDTVICRK